MIATLLDYDYRANSDWIAHLNELGNRCPEPAARWMSHIVNAHFIWLERMAARDCGRRVWEMVPRSRWEISLNENHERLRTEVLPHLASTFTYSNGQGEKFSNTFEQVLSHLVLHGQYHRGQIASAVKQATNTTVPTDFIFYNR